MTDQVSGSSLPQARDLALQQHQQHQQHQHQHQAQDLQHTHTRLDHVDIESLQQQHYDNDNNDNSFRHHHHQHRHQPQQHHHHHHHVRSPKVKEFPKRDISDDSSDAVVVARTISALPVTATGSTVIRTLSGDHPPSAISSSQSESTAVTSTAENASSSDLPGATLNSNGNGGGNGVVGPSSTASIVEEDSSVVSTESSMHTSFPTFSYASVAVTPSSRVPVFSPLSGHSNSTRLLSVAGSPTSSLHSLTTGDGNFTFFGGPAPSFPTSVFTNSALSTRFAQSTPSAVSTHSTATTNSTVSTDATTAIDSIVSTDSTASTDSTRSTDTTQSTDTTLSTHSTTTPSTSGTSTSQSTPTVSNVPNPANPNIPPANGGNGAALPTSTPTSSDSTSDQSTGNSSAATIAGSVVGAISGLAFIVLLILAFIRWKKHRSNKLIQVSGRESGHAAVVGGAGGPTGDGVVSEMRRSNPFATPPARGQSLSERNSAASVGTERGFTKISGRKLPSVLQFGGDGYTDPRGSTMSDQSIDYRASQNIPGEAILARLALGSPMLEDTGVPVFHASPARTAVTTSGPSGDPFSDDHATRSPTSPMLSPYSVGGSRPPPSASARSHAPFSRFTEDL